MTATRRQVGATEREDLLPSQAGKWPSPQAHDSENPKSADQVAAMRAEGHGVANLNETASQWPTPTSRDEKDGACADQDVETNALLGREAARWPTPQATDDHRDRCSDEWIRTTMARGNCSTELAHAARTFPCSLPAPGDGKSASMLEASGSSLSIETLPDGSRSFRKGPTSRRRLNPAFVEWLMGWPLGWTGYAAVETGSWWSKVRSLYASCCAAEES